jgi:hypothetical protein
MNTRLIRVVSIVVLVCVATISNTSAESHSLNIPPKYPLFTQQLKSPKDIHALDPQAYLPLTLSPPQFTPWVNTQNKETVRQLYLTGYLASEGISSEWSGSHASCNPGTTSEVFKQAILWRTNFFRSMSGIPSIYGFKDEYNQKAQAAALMMSVNRQLSHNPPGSWTCYSSDGYDGASSSNLYLGVYGPSAISGYIQDPGGGNYAVGHRRWILYPQTKYMGTGDIPSQSGYPSSNALWVFDTEHMWGPRPETRETFVAWPPPGYVPRQIVYPRWSFAYAHADFSSASVSITRNSQTVSVTVHPTVNGYGENTLVWELIESLPQEEVVYTVNITNVIISSIPQDFSYQVMIFDPYN